MPKMGRKYYEHIATMVCKMLKEKYKEELQRDASRHRLRRAAKKWQKDPRKKNDFAAIEAKLKAALEKEKAEKAEALSAIAAGDRREREAALVDAVAAKLGMTNRLAIKGMLRTLADSGLDTAPENLDDKIAADVAKQVREALGDLMPPKSAGSPGTPGVNLSTKSPSEKPGADPERERVRAPARSPVRALIEKDLDNASFDFHQLHRYRGADPYRIV